MRSKNLHELILSASAKWGGAIAFRHIYGGKVRQIRYNELSRLTYLFAMSFAGRGLKSGDRIILCADNSPEWVLACLGAFRLGLVVVPVDARSRQSDLETIAGKVKPSMFLLGRTQYQMLGASLDTGKVAVLDEVLTTIPSDLGERPKFQFPVRGGETEALIVFTSGTSGASKGVVLTHENILANVNAITERFDVGPKDRLLSVLPLSHMFEFTAGLMGPLVQGATIVYTRIKGPDHLRELLRIERPSVLIGVPAIFQNILKSVHSKIAQLPATVSASLAAAQKILGSGTNSGGAAYRINRMLMAPILNELGGRIKFWAAGGAPVSKELTEGLAQLGIPLLAGYGLTEASPIVAANTRGTNRPGSAGRPLRNVVVRIVPIEHGSDANGGMDEPVPLDTDATRDGEILVRGASVMQGYFEDAEATASVMDQKWLRTGDIGHLDSDGYLHVTGRLKSTIVTAGGYNIQPEEIEKVLETSPLIKESCVFGLSTSAGEQAYAVVVPSPDYADKAWDHRFFQTEISQCLADVAEYKRLAGFEVHSGSLPRTRSRKVRRADVSALYHSLMQQRLNSGEPRSHQWDEEGIAVCAAIFAVMAPGSTPYKTATELQPSDGLSGDLGIDSFARLELAVRLEETFAARITDEAINDVQTVDDVVALVHGQKGRLVENVNQVSSQNEHSLNAQYDVITNQYKFLDTGGHNLTHTLSSAVEPWPFSARPVALSNKPDPVYVNIARRSAVTALKAILRIYNQMEVEGGDRLLMDPPYIVVANHTSHVDTAAIFASFPTNLVELVHPIAAADTFFVDRISSMLSAHLLNALPFDRFGDFEKSLEECQQLLANGQILILFPEGTRSMNGATGVFRTGAARLAASAGCPIIPAYIDGAHEIMPKHAKLPRPGKLHVRYGTPLYAPPNASLKDVQELTLRVQEAVLSLSQASVR